MMAKFSDRLQHAWNAFLNKDPTLGNTYGGSMSSYRPDRIRLSRGNEKSIVTTVYNRIALDVSQITYKHVQLDDNMRYLSDLNTGLNNCLTLEANKDQISRSFFQDIVLSMFDEGVVAIVPIDTTLDPYVTGAYDIDSMRTGQVIDWFPDKVKVRVYNDRTGKKEDILVPKSITAIVENPFYAIMNEPNSTSQRLIRKLNLLDVIDEQSGAGKLDLIIQLPYVIKTDARRNQANLRRKEIEDQLAGSKYGIAYTDGTEHITQLNRSVNNNLMTQIEYLTTMLYSQLGITQSILDGTADDKTMLNYYNRVIEPIASAIVDEMKRKFLTKTARSQNKSIVFFRDPFKLVPVNEIAEIADKFTRNEIMSTNEIRQIVGMHPVNDPKADELRNKNLNPGEGQEFAVTTGELTENPIDEQMAQLDELDIKIDELEEMSHSEELIHYASPYYDPEKAHEYYEKHKQLKGRTSTAGLNEKGREAAKYVKEQINNEKKNNIQTARDTKDKEIDSAKNTKNSSIEQHTAAMNSRIEQLKDRLSGMSKADKSANRENINSLIKSLREENAAKKDQLREQYALSADSSRSTYRTKKEQFTNEANSKYESELSKIKSTSKFVSTKKSK